MAGKKKNPLWLSGLLALLAAFATWAAREWGEKNHKAMLYRVCFFCKANQSQKMVAEQAAKIAAKHRLGFAVDDKGKQEEGHFTCFLLTTEAAKAEDALKEMSRACGGLDYTCSRMKP